MAEGYSFLLEQFLLNRFSCSLLQEMCAASLVPSTRLFLCWRFFCTAYIQSIDKTPEAFIVSVPERWVIFHPLRFQTAAHQLKATLSRPNFLPPTISYAMQYTPSLPTSTYDNLILVSLSMSLVIGSIPLNNFPIFVETKVNFNKVQLVTYIHREFMYWHRFRLEPCCQAHSR